ncbi:sialic acid-binding Ig-like lectin 5 [Anabas testudineus]|uniref:sialic acid-binding Ig-like lectin 5 n=1 Tax=Anabas testudineus TaxID=64144 RepID=UPI000E4612ED|nr:sialic acid-binding Ig-like lectin 5 [Anabas testudineus]
MFSFLLFVTATSSLEKKCESGSYCTNLTKGIITAEAGLCVILPCSFTTEADFSFTEIIWFKCNSATKEKCDKSDTGKLIFNSSNNENIESEFKGRVSLLEPDVSKKNCSIIINDLRKSDSGSYQLRVNGNKDGKTDGFTFTTTATITVTVLNQKPTVTVPPLIEGHQTTLTCTAPGLCSGSVPEITWTWKNTGENDSYIPGNITEFKTENLTAVTQRHSSTLTFNTSAEHHSTEVTCKVNFNGSKTITERVTLNVTYVKNLNISGATTVKMGDTLNLTCSVDSFPASSMTWTKSGFNDSFNNNDESQPLTQGGQAFLIIHNMTADHSGQYICTAKHQIQTLTKHTNVTVTSPPKILNGSGCMNQSQVLTCVCISQGVPLPTITWPLLNIKYSVFTTVSQHTVNSSLTVPLTTSSRTTIECVSSNKHGETKENLTIRNDFNQNDAGYYIFIYLLNNSWLHVIVAFLLGILLSATIICSSRKCCRKKQKCSEDLAEYVEISTTQVAAGQEVEDDWTHDHPGESAPADDDVEVEAQYSNIDFSLLKQKNPTEVKKRETTETEYTEIKKETTCNGGEEGEMLEGNAQEGAITDEDKETEQCILTVEEGGEDVALYSTVNEELDQI